MQFFCGIPIRSSPMVNRSPEPVQKEHTQPNRGSVAEDSAISVPDHLPSTVLTTMLPPIFQTESCPLQHTEVNSCVAAKASSVPRDISQTERSCSAGEQTNSCHCDLPTSVDNDGSNTLTFSSVVPRNVPFSVHEEPQVIDPERSIDSRRQLSSIPQSQLPTDPQAEPLILPQCKSLSHSQTSPTACPAHESSPISPSSGSQHQASFVFQSET